MNDNSPRLPAPLAAAFQKIEQPIEGVELLRLDVEAERHFSHGVWHNRQHAILGLQSGEHIGWGECIASTGNPELDLATWGAVLCQLAGATPREAFEILHQSRDVWPHKQLEMAEMALLDLVGKLAGVSVLEMLGLEGREPVAGLFCILESGPQRAAERARFALQNNLKTHAKIKIFGDNDLDICVIQAVREAMGSQTFLSADANGGYKSRGDALIGDLKRLQNAGLNAVEDPAKLSVSEWVELQSAVGDLSLIPDAPLRPAWAARRKIVAGMGRIYNIHPGCSGSLVEAVALARQIQGFGAQLMVGDDSLVGPACTAWQQMAIGLGAAWCEALEKPDESSQFLECVRGQSTAQNAEGRFGLTELRPGFGLDVDSDALRAKCTTTHRFENSQI